MKSLNRETLTPREIEEFKQDMQMAEKQADYGLRVKELELELARLETKWTQVWRLPLAVINLPVRVLFAFGFIALCIVKKEPTDKFWEYIRG